MIKNVLFLVLLVGMKSLSVDEMNVICKLVECINLFVVEIF